MKTIHLSRTTLAALLMVSLFSACRDDNGDPNEGLGPLTPSENVFGKANDTFSAEEWYPGGELGTTDKASYSAAAPAVERVPGMENDFNVGEDFFEHLYTFEQQPRKGLGPAWVRNSCIACHPSYGHGKRQTEYRANTICNGYLLVVYHPNEAFTSDGVRYTVAPSSYISEVTGMPQTAAMNPFKAPIDEKQISIEWKNVNSMPSGLAMAFPDGEKYELIYPEVNIPVSAFNTNPKPTNYEVRLESTIGLYGTGLIDAISDEDMREQYRAEAAAGVQLNPAMWDKAANDFAPTAYYSAPYNDLGTGEEVHLCHDTRLAARRSRRQRYMEYHQRDPQRPPLALHHSGMGQGTKRGPGCHQLHQGTRFGRDQHTASLLCRRHQRGHRTARERTAEYVEHRQERDFRELPAEGLALQW